MLRSTVVNQIFSSYFHDLLNYSIWLSFQFCRILTKSPRTSDRHSRKLQDFFFFQFWWYGNIEGNYRDHWWRIIWALLCDFQPLCICRLMCDGACGMTSADPDQMAHLHRLIRIYRSSKCPWVSFLAAMLTMTFYPSRSSVLGSFYTEQKCQTGSVKELSDINKLLNSTLGNKKCCSSSYD